MNCPNCGVEITRENAKFCTSCGASIAVKKKKSPVPFIIGGVAAAILIAVLIIGINYARSRIIRNTIKEAATKVMDSIKSGPDEEQTEQMIAYVKKRVLNDAANSDNLLSRTLSAVVEKGLEVLDTEKIYDVLVCCMKYEIQDVQEMDSSHYSVSIYVENVNAKKVALDTIKSANYISIAADLLMGKTEQLVKKLLADYEDRATEVYEDRDKDYIISGTYTVDFVKKKGEWTVDSKDGLLGTSMDLLSTCLGFES